MGNSFTRHKAGGITYSVEQILEELAEAGGYDLEAAVLAHGGAYLTYYAGMSKKYLSYYKELLQLLSSETWDYIILQEYSKGPIARYDTDTLPALQQLLKLIEDLQPQAKPLLYMTHGYNNGTKTKVNGVSRKLTIDEMELYLAAAYHTLGNQLGVEVVPSGMHMNRASRIYPEINLLEKDLKHPVYAGYYIAACCFYNKIYGTTPDPGNVSLTNCNLTEQELKNLAALTGDSLTMNRQEFQLNVNKTSTLSTTPKRSDITYKSLDKSVASVNSATGVVTAKASGRAKITVTSKDDTSIYDSYYLYVLLDTPKDLKAGSTGNPDEEATFGNIKISWDSVAEATGYNIYRSTKKDGTYAQIGTSKTNSYIDWTVKANTAYYYKVEAKNAYALCTSPLSGSIKGIILKATTLKSKVTKKSYVRLTWTRNTKASGYIIYRSKKKNSGYKKLTTITSGSKTSYTDKTVTNGTYYYRIKAYKTINKKNFLGIKCKKVKVKIKV